MNEIKKPVIFVYFLLGNLSTPLGFLTSVSREEAPSTVILRFLGAHADHVSVGEDIFALTEGEVTLPASLFGEKTAVTPLSFASGARYLCPAILKKTQNGATVLVANTAGEDALLSLSRDTDAMASALTLLSGKVKELTDAVKTRPFRLGGAAYEA